MSEDGSRTTRGLKSCGSAVRSIQQADAQELQLVNRCPGTIDEAITCAPFDIDRIRTIKHLPHSFLQHTVFSP
ncbi:hypothetical protein [Saccharopolyspora shandongensis]|uniref:hypothetical protein n=1 Tax=Saccharopolyspora shandongensis TaxID=418495 RepID=UPI0034028469